MKASSLRLFVESLEARTTLSSSPWLNPTELTLSFVPDGTSVGNGLTSNLTAMLGSSSTTSWETTILRAFQSWASQANINIAVVPDGGEPLGATGLPQGDPRFGDIRIAAAPLGNPATAGLAQTVTATGTGGTLQGDVVLNSNAPINVGGTGGDYDLFSVLLHEAGHSFGFPDETTNPASVMYTTYQPEASLPAIDVANLQAVYGTPTGDPFGSGITNTTTGTAFDLTRHGNLSLVSGDIAQIGGVEVFRFTTPAAQTGISGLTVNVQAAGISLFTPEVTILNASGSPVASAVAAGPLANTVSVTLPNYAASTTYFVQIQGANNNLFSDGAFNLQLNYSKNFGNTFNYGSRVTNSYVGQNLSVSTALDLSYVSSQTTDFTAIGSIGNAGSSNWYRIDPSSISSFTGTLTVGVVTLDSSGLLPMVTVYNSLGQPLQSSVVANENGTFTVQLPNQQTSTVYYLQVSAQNSTSGSSPTGRYALWSDLSQIAPTVFTSLTSGTLTAASNTIYSQLTINDTRLLQFSLSATEAASGPTEAVRVSIFDSNGNTVFTAVAFAGSPLVTGTVWLQAGTYTVVFNAAAANGETLSNLTYQLSDIDLTNPVDPYPVDPTDPTSPPISPPPPPPPVVVVVSPPAPLPPLGVVVGAIVNPLTGL